MPGTTAFPEEELIVEDIGGGGGGTKPPQDGGDDGGDGDNRRRPDSGKGPSANRYFTGITIGLISILMFFMALSAAFLLRRWLGSDWVPLRLPTILWANTAVIIASSFTLERARRALQRLDGESFRLLWTTTTGLGLLFLMGQLVAWRLLVAQGVFMASNPASSFFYIFTAAHGVHLLGGIAALVYVLRKKTSGKGITLPTAAEVVSYYWHFMDGLWVFLLALLYLGK